MSEWAKVSLSEVATIIPGFAFKSKEFSQHGTPVVKIKDINPPLVNLSDLARIDEDAYPLGKLDKYRLHSGDFVVAMTGATIGKVGRYVSKERGLLNQRVAKISPIHSVSWDFIYHAVSMPYFDRFIENNIDSESAQANISASGIGRYPIALPKLKEQEAIAEVLSSLDDKIDLLKRQNKTLEGMAEALFRQWFIEEAQDDWEEIELNKHLEFGSGFPFKSNTYLEQGQYRIATIKHVQDGFLDLSDAPFLGCLPEKIKPHCILNQGDVILSLTGNVGRCCMIDKDNVLLNQRVASILPYDGAQLPFWYFFFRYPATKGILDQLSHGTAQKNLSTRVLGFEKFQLPPTNKICSRVPAFKAIFDKILDNHKTMEILESQRNTILPKLMSGKVRVQMD